MTKQLMRILNSLAIPIVGVGIAGCFPSTLVWVPAMHGRVVDAQSRPVPDATVELISDRPGSDPIVIKTESDGTFHQEEKHRDFVYLPAMHVVRPPTYSVVVSVNGQRVPTTQVSGGVRSFGQGPSASGQDLGDLRLP